MKTMTITVEFIKTDKETDIYIGSETGSGVTYRLDKDMTPAKAMEKYINEQDPSLKEFLDGETKEGHTGEYCPCCGHEFRQGEFGFDYDSAHTLYECPECGWGGNENGIILK